MTVSTLFNTDHAPGTILKDMTSFLRYVQENELEITGNKGLLPNHCLSEINAVMSHPLKLALKREQQMSYPHISALYLLSRSLGLIQIAQNKSKRFLTIDAEVMAKWDKLNEVEKYFGLMQAWLFLCDERLINQGKHASFLGILGSAYRFVKENMGKELEFTDKEDQRWKLYGLKLYSLALLEMFGLVNVQDKEESVEKSWLISRISVSDFGKTWIQLLEKINCQKLALHFEDSAEAMHHFHQRLTPFVPKWKTCIELKKKTTDLGLHFFKVSLSKKIWRRISIQGSQSMGALSGSILDAFDFDNDHLYRFTYTDRFGISKTVNDFRGDEPPYADEVSVGDIDIQIGDEIEFLFDFGDSWLFAIQLEKIDPHFKNEESTVIESFGEAPEQYPVYEDH